MRRVMRALVALVLSVVAVAGVPRPAAAAGPVRIWNAMSPDWCLIYVLSYDVYGSPCWGSPNRTWLFVPAMNPYRTDDFNIVSARGWQNECLEQQWPDNPLVWLAPCDHGSNQEWLISLSTHGNVYRNAASQWCLDMSHVGGEPNGTVVAWPCYRPPSRNQQWIHG